jgi:hypothetical protein
MNHFLMTGSRLGDIPCIKPRGGRENCGHWFANGYHHKWTAQTETRCAGHMVGLFGSDRTRPYLSRFNGNSKTPRDAPRPGEPRFHSALRYLIPQSETYQDFRGFRSLQPAAEGRFAAGNLPGDQEPSAATQTPARSREARQ